MRGSSPEDFHYTKGFLRARLTSRTKIQVCYPRMFFQVAKALINYSSVLSHKVLDENFRDVL